MLAACTLLLLLAGLLAPAHGSAIKGHQAARVHADDAPARSVKLAPPANSNLDKTHKAPQAPVLESSRKVYNDESIRRSALALEQQQAAQAALKAPDQPIQPVQPVQPVQPAQPAVPAAAQSQPAPVVEQVAPVAGAPVPPAPAAPPIPVVPTGEPKVAPGEPAKVRPDELPAQSERAAPARDEKPAAYSAPVVRAAEPAGQPPQQAPALGQPAPVEQPGVGVAQPVPAESQLQAKKDEPAAEPAPIEVPAPDPGLVLSEPIDSTTKLLIDLDEHVQKFLPAEDKQEPAQPAKEQVLVSGVDYSPAAAAPGAEPSGKSALPVPYSSSSVADAEPIVPPLPSLEGVEKASAGGGPTGPQASPAAGPPAAAQAAGSSATRQASHGPNQNQQQVITQLLDQLDSLQNRIQDTINQLVARRRYVMSALLRPMGTYVRRVRTNLERLQNRVNQLQAAAVSVGGGGQNRPGGFVDAAAIETIRRRIDDISKRISDIVNRIRFSLTPTSAPLNSNGRK